MCGIIGISSNKPVSANIINSLKKLEYRGYDSAGIATLSDGYINEVKSEGRVENLEKNFDLKVLSGNIGIGHVRWATHGVPNSVNAHPHSSDNVSVVHNGIIENSTLLKKHLINHDLLNVFLKVLSFLLYHYAQQKHCQMSVGEHLHC